uniref:Uncharacterized protein n=1 Tax=Sphaeramia orbicularis TaxID=375764 RepID=A0A672Z3T9_9TELE
MAAPSAMFRSVLLHIFWILSDAAATENTTSYGFNTTVFADQNDMYNFTDNYTTTENTPFGSTTPTPSSGTAEPPVLSLPVEPLPVSGRLLPSVTDVVILCPCNDHQDVCDANCCCDRQCSEEVALFTGCSVHSVSGSGQLCSRDVASYALRSKVDGYSELQSSVQKETKYDAFCIQSQNRVDGLAHPSPALPTDTNFEWLFQQFSSFVLGSEKDDAQVPAAQPQASSGYQYGDVLERISDSGQREIFSLPASAVTAECVDNNAAAFLMEQSSRCFRSVDLQQDCRRLPPLSVDAYTNIQLLAGKNKDAVVVPVEVGSIVLQSLDGTKIELELSGGEDLRPVLVSPSVCANVVLKVVYAITHNPAGEILSAMLSLVLGFVQEALLPLEQTFHVMFVQEVVPQLAVRSSGNPGYVVGLPLVSGQRTAEYPSDTSILGPHGGGVHGFDSNRRPFCEEFA